MLWWWCYHRCIVGSWIGSEWTLCRGGAQGQASAKQSHIGISGRIQQRQSDHCRHYLNSCCYVLFNISYLLCVVSHCPIALVQHICKHLQMCKCNFFFLTLFQNDESLFQQQQRETGFSKLYFKLLFLLLLTLLNFICNVAKKKNSLCPWPECKAKKKNAQVQRATEIWWMTWTFCCCCYFSFPRPPLSLSTLNF